jgi:hypothetical protein
MRLVDTAEGPTDPVGELVSAEQSLRLDYLAFAVDPLGLYRIEPGTLGRQKAGNYPYSSFATTIFDLAVVGGNPASTWRLLCHKSLSQIKSRPCCPSVGASRSTIQETAWLWRSRVDHRRTSARSL